MNDADAAAARFQALLERHRPPTGGVALQDITKEAAPVLPLLCELPAAERARGDFDSFEYRECFTVLTLLGRRLALLDLTPSGALQVVQLALRAVGAPEEPTDSTGLAFEGRAIGAVVEGFVLGREERVEQTAQVRAAAPIAPLPIEDGVVALIVSGTHEPAVLSGCAEDLGRVMLDADASVAIVDLSQLGEPTPDRAAAIFSADEVTRMLGATCVFSGLDDAWRTSAAQARIAIETVVIAPRLQEAIGVARELAHGPAQPATRGWRGLLRKLAPPRRGDARK